MKRVTALFCDKTHQRLKVVSAYTGLTMIEHIQRAVTLYLDHHYKQINPD
jgi:hypothetical protein